MQLSVHLFLNEALAAAAVDSLDAILSYPRGDAQHYATYQPYNGKYFIVADDVTEGILLDEVITITIAEIQ